MSVLKGTDTYQRQTSAKAEVLPDGQSFSGDIRQFFGKYTFLGTEVSGDQIPLVKLPVGAIFIPEDSRVSSDGAAGTSVTVAKVGDAGDDDRYSATGININAAVSGTALTPTNAICVTPFVIDTDANSTLLATITHSGAPTAGKVLVVRGRYRLP